MIDTGKTKAAPDVAPERVPTSLRRHLILSGLVRDAVSLKRASTSQMETAAQQRLLDRLGRLHGLPQKIGQLIAMGEMHAEPNSPRATLTETPVLDLEEVKGILAAELPVARFAWIDAVAIPASLGQVHRAKLDDGRDVAVKVQFPGIGSSIETDLRCLGWLASPLGNLRRDFSMAAYRLELGTMLREELDYRREASTLSVYAGRLAAYPQLTCPTPIDALCSDRVITMSWVDGQSVEECRGWGVQAREEAGRELLKFFLLGLLEWGEIFADAHPGNFRFRIEKGRAFVGVVDFGCIRTTNAGMTAAFHTIMGASADGAIRRMSPDELFVLYGTAGFDRNLLDTMKAKLPAITELLFEPFGPGQPFRAGEWRLRERAAEILGEDRWNFRTAGPPTLLGFIRAYHGLLKHLEILAPTLDWRRVFEEVRSRAAVVAAAVSASSVTSPMEQVVSTVLRIRVQRHGRIQAELTFKGHLAGELPDLVPPELLPEIERRGIDVGALAQEAARTGFAPAELFRHEYDGKILRVWLEEGGAPR